MRFERKTFLVNAVMDKPFTEQSNPLSESIDICNAEEIVGILAKTDEQIFSGVNDRVSFNIVCYLM